MYAAGHRAHSLGKKDKPSGPAVVVTSNTTGRHSASNLPTGIRPKLIRSVVAGRRRPDGSLWLQNRPPHKGCRGRIALRGRCSNVVQWTVPASCPMIWVQTNATRCFLVCCGNVSNNLGSLGHTLSTILGLSNAVSKATSGLFKAIVALLKTVFRPRRQATAKVGKQTLEKP